MASPSFGASGDSAITPTIQTRITTHLVRRPVTNGLGRTLAVQGIAILPERVTLVLPVNLERDDLELVGIDQPGSVILRDGITDRPRKLSVMNGARTVTPSELVAARRSRSTAATAEPG